MHDWKKLRRIILVAGSLLGLVTPTHARETHSIGEVGVVLELDTHFERAQGDASLGKDQFRVKRGNYLVWVAFLEIDSVVSGEVVHRRMLDSFIENLGLLGQDLEIEEPFVFRREGDLEYSAVESSMRENTGEIHRETSIVSQGGRGSFLFVWAMKQAADDVHTIARAVRRGLRFPGPSDLHGTRFVPVAHSVELVGHSISIAASPVLLQPSVVAPNKRLELESEAGDLNVYVLPFVDSNEARRGFSLILDALRYPASEVVPDPIRELEVDGRPLRSIVVPLPGDATKFIDCSLVDLGDGRFVDVRIQYPAPIDSLAEIRRELLTSLKIRRLPELDLEFVEQPTKTIAAPFLALQDVLSKAALIGELPAPLADATCGADGAIVLSTTTGAVELNPTLDGFDVILADRPERRARFTCRHRGAMWTLDPDRCVVVRDGIAEPAPADLWAIVEREKDELIGVRGVPARDELDAVDFGSSIDVEVVRVTPEGTIESIAELGMVGIGDIALDPTKRFLFVVHWLTRPTVIRESVRLLRVDLETGETKEVGEWRTLLELAPSDRGILVTGQAVDGRRGIHRVDERGGVELVLGGSRLVGLAERNGRLLIAARFAPMSGSAEVDGLGWIGIDSIGTNALGAAPPTTLDLEAVATRALEAGSTPASRVLDSQEAVDAFLSRADEAARSLGLPDLPRTAAQVDEFLRVECGNRAVGESTLVLVMALAIRALCDPANDGVRFVAPLPGHDALRAKRGKLYPAQTAFVIGCDLSELMLRNFETDTTTWFDIESIVEFAKRASVLVGTDRVAIEQAVEAATPSDALDRIDERMRASTDPKRFDELVRELIEKKVASSYRRALYDRLAHAADAAALEHVASAFVEASYAGEDIDHVALVRARLARARDAESSAAVIDVARKAVERHPSSIRCWLALGDVYRRSGVEQSARLARLCYDGARERDSDGAWEKEIAAAIALLESN